MPIEESLLYLNNSFQMTGFIAKIILVSWDGVVTPFFSLKNNQILYFNLASLKP